MPKQCEYGAVVVGKYASLICLERPTEVVTAPWRDGDRTGVTRLLLCAAYAVELGARAG